MGQGLDPGAALARTATGYWDAAFHDGSQTLRNLGTGGSALDARFGSSTTTGVTITPGTGVYLPGVAGNYLSVPDSAALDITGDIDIRCKVALDDWTPASTQMLIGKENEGSQRSYWLVVNTSGTLTLWWSTTGSDFPSAVSTVATGLADGSTKWVRVTLDVDNGASGKTAKFYTSDDGSSWTQLGSDVTSAGTTSIFASTTALTIGSYSAGTNFLLTGKVYRAQVYNGIAGTKVLDVDCSTVQYRESRSFLADTGQVVTIVSASDDSNDPLWLPYYGTPYVYLPGASGNYLSTPDAAALDITGDIDIRVKVAMDDWTPAADSDLVAKWVTSTANRSYIFRVNSSGMLQIVWSADGSTFIASNSTVSTGLTDGSVKWVRVTLDVDNGAGGNDAKFWLSDDGSTWTQLGATVTTAGTTSIFSGSAPVEVGTAFSGTARLAAGKFYRAQVLNGIGGTTVLDVDTSVLTSGAATSFTATTGQTVTINRATSGRKTVVVANDGSRFLLGTDDYLSVADNSLLDFGASDDFTVLVTMRQWATIINGGGLVTKGASNARSVTSKRWVVRGFTSSQWFMLADDGTNYNETTAAALTFTAGTLTTLGATASTSVMTPYQAGAAGTTASRTAGDLSNSSPMRIGEINGTYNDFEFGALVVDRRKWSATEVLAYSNYMSNRRF